MQTSRGKEKNNNKKLSKTHHEEAEAMLKLESAMFKLVFLFVFKFY
jgi:hypothetical protein